MLRLLHYMSWVRQNLAGSKGVSGIILTEFANQNLKAIVNEVPNVSLRYSRIGIELLDEMERGNLFTLSLGNVQPNDVIAIRFAYFEELDAWKEELALQIPFSKKVCRTARISAPEDCRSSSSADRLPPTEQKLGRNKMPSPNQSLPPRRSAATQRAGVRVPRKSSERPEHRIDRLLQEP
jgi:hypothetical protein